MSGNELWAAMIVAAATQPLRRRESGFSERVRVTTTDLGCRLSWPEMFEVLNTKPVFLCVRALQS
ncbi:hypothetical protein [Amycolatopsis sp. DSM 110486]|uniref:hypothetical protein n=1 Tax=Amycolatopsis sp. DSM 110486 TaxID=2865832 RepID=UPI001C696EA4|nr:hypothetical protein [Amycolatopsis sp. DSM 110486]QYN16598.1 hypothetical protein K1T34_27370 [Amycolatopsis sp. DSM 110486]